MDLTLVTCGRIAQIMPESNFIIQNLLISFEFFGAGDKAGLGGG